MSRSTEAIKPLSSRITDRPKGKTRWSLCRSLSRVYVGASVQVNRRTTSTCYSRKFTSESFALDDDAGGKTGRVARPEVAPRGREAARGQIACAIC